MPDALNMDFPVQHTQVDTSMYARAPQTQPNMLDTMQGLAQLQNSVNQNRLFQQDIRTRGAVANAIKSSIDEQSGEFDPFKAAKILSMSPDASLVAPDIINKWITNKTLQGDAFLKDMEVGMAKRSHLIQVLGSVAHQGVTHAEIAKAAGQAVALGATDAPTVAAVLGNLAPEGPKLEQQMTGLLRSIQSADALAGNTYSKLQMLDTGGSLLPTVYNPADATIGAIAQPISKTLSPGESADVVKYTDKDMREHTTTKGALAQQQAQMADQTTAQPIPSPMDIAVGPSAGEKAYAEKRAGEMGEYKSDLDQTAAAASYSLQNLDHLDKVMKTLNTGGGATAYQTVGSLLDAFGVPRNTVDAVSLGSRAGSQIFEKIKQNLIQTTLRQAYGGLGRVMQIEYQNHAKTMPDLGMDPRAISAITGFMRRTANIARMKQALYNKIVNKKINPETGEKMTPDDFPVYWEKFLTDNKIVKPGLPPELEAQE